MRDRDTPQHTVGKEDALRQLRTFDRWRRSRDPLVRRAKQAGATYSEMIAASGLSRDTIATIIKNQQEQEIEVMTDQPTWYPHHPHFEKKEGTPFGVQFHFRPFTGNEPEPEAPELPDFVGVDADAKSREWYERCEEYHQAWLLWAEARYRRDAEPLVRAVCDRRPSVDAAIADMRAAWDALDTAPVWQPAVKRLLEAQENARDTMLGWANRFALPLVELESRQPREVQERLSWKDIARELGYTPDFGLGFYTVGEGWDSGPEHDLNQEIRRQSLMLEKIAQYSGENRSERDDTCV